MRFPLTFGQVLNCVLTLCGRNSEILVGLREALTWQQMIRECNYYTGMFWQLT